MVARPAVVQVPPPDAAENKALLAQDRAIQELALRIGTCLAAGTVAECPDVLEAGAAVADAEDDFHNGTTDAARDQALDTEADAIDALRPTLRTCGSSVG